jgi:hypothetical protein
MFRYRTLSLTLGLLFVLAATPAYAQLRPGVQGGLSVDPDQAFVGGHVQTDPLVDHLRFRPGIDIGFGDDVTLVAVNFDFTYTFPSGRPWDFYVGGGPSVNYFDRDGGSETETGLNFLFGAAHTDGMFFEMRLGALDSPDLKFTVGYTFR